MEADIIGFKVVYSFNTFNEFGAALERFRAPGLWTFGVVTAAHRKYDSLVLGMQSPTLALLFYLFFLFRLLFNFEGCSITSP